MITPKIEFPHGYDPADARQFITTSQSVKGLTPGEIWQYLINISDWDRFAPSLMDADFIDPQVQDPHLFHKAEFTYTTPAMKLEARVLECIPPKADRPGRISWRAVKQGDAGKQFEMVQAWVIEIGPDHETQIITEAALDGPLATDAVAEEMRTINDRWVPGLVEYVTKKLTQTNHPRP